MRKLYYTLILKCWAAIRVETRKSWEVWWEGNENEKYQSLNRKQINYTALGKEGNAETNMWESDLKNLEADNNGMHIT